MAREVRYGAFLREIAVAQRRISYRELVPPLERDAAGREIPCRPPKLRLRPMEVYRILEPYVAVRLREQVRAVVPLALYLALFQIVILRVGVADGWLIGGGLAAAIVGLMLFLEGLKVGLMPFGEAIGTTLPSKATLPFVLLIAFLLGVGVTYAEPAIGALKAAGRIVSADRAPYLHALLNGWSGALVLVVGVGVGLAAVLGTLRFLYGWSLKPLIYLTLIPTLALTLYLAGRPDLRDVLGLAWDAGGVTTGPVTVPLVLALGIGIAAAAGRGSSSLSGFGIVTLASILPVLAVLLLGLYVASTVPPEAIRAAAAAAPPAGDLPWWERTPGLEIVSGFRAVVPLVLFLLAVLAFLRERLRHPGQIAYGIVLSVLGMILFSLGLTFGLARLGAQSGELVPAAFTEIPPVAGSPLYVFSLGLGIAFLFAWALGFGATLAEPALNALGLTVENLTNGAFRKSVLMSSVSAGVAAGIAVGVLKITFDIPMAWLLAPSYAGALLLTALSSEEFVNVAWDSAGVTTGPVTVPLVLAMGLGFSDAVGAAEGFGILALASIGPVLAVLATGLWIERQIRRRHRAQAETGREGATA